MTYAHQDYSLMCFSFLPMLYAGNGYSDEILWETRINPYCIAAALPEEKVKELAKAIKTVLTNATQQIRQNHPGLVLEK